MAQWIAFFLMMGIPLVWLFVADGRDDDAMQTSGQPVGGFRVASAELEIGTGPGALDEIQDALAEFCATHGRVPDSVLMGIGIAVAEVAANIVEYSDAKKVRMAVTLNPNRIQVGLIDDGAPVEVDLDSVDMPDDFAESGRGLPMAKAVLSELSYEREGSTGNQWMLVSKPFDGHRLLESASA